MTTFADAENALDEACGTLERLQLGKFEEAITYREAAREAIAIANKDPNDFKAAERAERLEVAEAEALWAFPILRNAAEAAAEAASVLIVHGAAKAAATLEAHIAEMTERVDNLAAIFDEATLEGDALAAANLEGKAGGLILAARILGKAAQAMRAAAETAEADNALE